MNLSPDIREITRYLGLRGADPDEALLREIQVCVSSLQEVVTPRFVYERFPLSVKKEPDETPLILFEELEIRSRDLAKNLEGCSGVYVMAATLGPGPDRLITRAAVDRMSRVVIYQAAAAAMTETLCDHVEEQIRREAAQDGLFLRPRFSPGYGDLPLELQKEISRILNMPKEIGISLTETLLMTPTKSVTALIGLSDKPGECRGRGCEECGASERCPYRA